MTFSQHISNTSLVASYSHCGLSTRRYYADYLIQILCVRYATKYKVRVQLVYFSELEPVPEAPVMLDGR